MFGVGAKTEESKKDSPKPNSPKPNKTPTPDKPDITFAVSDRTGSVDHSFTIRVPSCQDAYETLKSRGAKFLTPPHDWGSEIRAFFRDPDGHLFEISESR